MERFRQAWKNIHTAVKKISAPTIIKAGSRICPTLFAGWASCFFDAAAATGAEGSGWKPCHSGAEGSDASAGGFGAVASLAAAVVVGGVAAFPSPFWTVAEDFTSS